MTGTDSIKMAIERLIKYIHLLSLSLFELIYFGAFAGSLIKLISRDRSRKRKQRKRPTDEFVLRRCHCRRRRRRSRHHHYRHNVVVVVIIIVVVILF